MIKLKKVIFEGVVMYDVVFEQHVGFANTGYGINIEKATIENDNFREVLYTTETMQLVLMSIKDDIGEEIHPRTTQFFRVEKGKGQAVINGETIELKDGMCVVIPPGARHNIINTGKTPLKVYTLYAPPKHAPGETNKEKPLP